ncbi:DUF4352 domain-containing protein [Proteiniclasticum sp.]|uniref:DUF4352 domain-containing protein n=1 Tax=Proteiniclasticum sp. TaxID=2053595 RepID=UPI0028965812|nr:DUF4352 domain-containing protein [Proteiniclasticum sp.]
MRNGKFKKPFYKKWWVWVLAVIVIGAALSGGGDGDPNDGVVDNEKPVAEEASEQPEESATPIVEEEIVEVGIGTPATIAGVSFTVNTVEETKKISSGNEFIEDVETEGKFLILDITIKNDKKEPITIDSSFFKLITSNKVEYDPNTDGAVIMAMMNEADFFLQQVNPGLSKTGKVIFEVGADIDLNSLILRGQTGFWGTETVEISLKQ